MGDLVVIKKQDNKEVPVTTSRIIAGRTNNTHEAVVKLIQTYENRLKKYGRVRFEIDTLETKGGNQKSNTYYLNEMQSTLLVTFMKNTEKVVDFKVELVEQFFEMRQLLQEKSTNEWQQARFDNKAVQKDLNDSIQKFVGYAVSQGSINWQTYYNHFARLSNKVVNIQNGKRDLAHTRQLIFQTIINDIIINTIEESMTDELPYKAIYQLCKERVIDITSKAYLRIS